MSEKPKRKRPESNFLRNFGKSWKRAGGYWYKIPDASGPSAMFSPARPYDVSAAMLQKIFVIEGKYCKTHQFGVNQMKPHQIPALVEAHAAGFKAFVLVCYDRLQGKVADFFSVSVLVNAQRENRNWIGPEEAVLRVYAANASDWIIIPRKIAAM